MWIQFTKEMLELFRDKKNLLLTILMPIVLMPLMMIGSILLIENVAKTEIDKVKYYILVNEIPTQMQLALDDNSSLAVKDFDPDFKQLIKDGDISFALAFNDNEYEVFYNGSDFINNNQAMISDIIDEQNIEFRISELLKLGLSETEQTSLLTHIKFKQTDLASIEQISTKAIGGLLPFLAIILMAVSAIATSSDICAGEKERQTMETLMLSPNSILNTLMGKWFAVTVFSLISGFLMLLSFSVGITVFKSMIDIAEVQKIFSIMNMPNILMTMLILIPASGIISSLLIATSTIASSFKEAQSYGSIALMLIMLPQGVVMTGIIEISNQSIFYPLINLSLWLQSFFNQSAQFSLLIPIILVNLVLISSLLTIAYSLYKSERIIFKQ
ncbi:MAG: ABC transporter permease [Saccharospirillaceae bacterium]|nr:ABC transporter permease subunit [Pseudomonadales bacterium]NRB77884.1 ABC transporter permease [Saccharospirillaceae bacterium]